MFYFTDFYGKKILKSTLLNEIEHFFTTKEFMLTEGELPEKSYEAQENRRFLCGKLSVPIESIKTAKQIHSANTEIVCEDINIYENCDALVSSIENSLMLLNFADCVPIILFDNKNNIASVVHAGWRGTANKIAQESVEVMKEKFNSKPENIKAAIGPSIGECCFAVDENVYSQLVKSSLTKDIDKIYRYDSHCDKYYIDLKNLNKIQLLDKGLFEIDVCGYCTSCMSDIFFSYRKENGKTARHSAVVKLGKRR